MRFCMPRLMPFVLLLLVWLGPVSASEAVDRGKLLSEAGVYGTFAAFTLDAEWAKEDQATRIAYLTVLRGVVEQHREKIVIDLYLMRGLSDYADLMFRVHAVELREAQNFLLDLQGSLFGRHLKAAGIMHGLTKKANYVPGLPDQMKADLKTVSEPGPRPYAIVIPISKNTDWWGLNPDKRLAMMKEHTEAALPYQKTVKRKLYHSTGLGDIDFITYFETSKLENFHSLILALEKVKEFQYVSRLGHPVLMGTAISLPEIMEILAQ